MAISYQPLDEKTRRESTDEEQDDYFRRPSAQQASAKALFTVSIIMLIASATMLVLAYNRVPSELECAKRVSPWSPMWDGVEFWEGDPTNYWNHSTIYRGPPTAEREKAWDDLWHHPSIAVDDAGIAALNKTNHGRHIQTVDSDPEHPTYAALVEVFHQLHCLNLIRQYTWHLMGRYDPNDETIIYPEDFIDPVAGRMHVDHCIEALRIDLMCYGDVTPLLLEYDEHRKVGETADFSVHHQCRNFDKIVEWVHDNHVSIAFSPAAMHGDHS